MTNPNQSSKRQQEVTSGFNLAAAGYDTPVLRFLPACAKRLVELAGLQNGQKVLDIATGTGTAAITAARIVGSSGLVVGVDLAQDMLKHAQQKMLAACIANIELRQEDAEKLSFDGNSFDAVICASGIFFMPDMVVALREWHRVTQPGGVVAFSSFLETAFKPMAETYKAQVEKYGVVFPPGSARLDTPEKCIDLMQTAGFEDIEVQTEQLGYYLGSLDEWWELVWNAGFRISLSQIPGEKLEQFKAEHLAEIENLMTDKGIWLDVETILVRGRKSPVETLNL